MDAPPKKRRFWQLHPYTIVASCFMAGAVLTLNGWERFHYASPVENVYGIGFPFFYQDIYGAGVSLDLNPTNVDRHALLYDIVIGTLLFLGMMIVSEVLIRRREARKP